MIEEKRLRSLGYIIREKNNFTKNFRQLRIMEKIPKVVTKKYMRKDYDYEKGCKEIWTRREHVTL